MKYIYVSMLPMVFAIAAVVSFPAQSQAQIAECLDFSDTTFFVGKRDADVSRLQQFLRDTNNFTYPTNTGYFGTVTAEAVGRFQLEYGVVTSAGSPGYGSVGPLTRAKIKEVSCGSAGSDPARTQGSAGVDPARAQVTGAPGYDSNRDLTGTSEFDPARTGACVSFSGIPMRVGQSDATTNGDVTRLQTYLRTTGDYVYPTITGYYGPVTEAAVEQFQSRYGLSTTGIADTELLSRVKTITCGGNVVNAPPTVIGSPVNSSLSVATPNGGEVWKMGSILSPFVVNTIYWNGQGLTGTISIDLVFADGSSCALPESGSIPSTAGAYAFRLTTGYKCKNSDRTVTPGLYRVRVSGMGENGRTYSDMSDGFFTITSELPTITSTPTEDIPTADEPNITQTPITTSTFRAPTVDLKINGSDTTTTVKSGAAFTISWNSTAASSCTAAGDWGAGRLVTNQSRSTSDARTVSASTWFVYDIFCTGYDGSTVTDRVQVLVEKPEEPTITQTPITPTFAAPTAKLTVNGASGNVTVKSGTPFTLAWNSTGVSSCTAAGDWKAGSLSPNRSGSASEMQVVSASRWYIYDLFCVGYDGSTAFDRVQVLVEAATITQTPIIPVIAPTATFTVNSGSSAFIKSGASANLSWSSSNANSCSISGALSRTGLATSGTLSTGILTNTTGSTASKQFYLNCSGAGGTVTKSVFVEVEEEQQNTSTQSSVSPYVAPVPTVSLLANNTDSYAQVNTGTPFTLSWSSTNATACTATQSWSGTKGISGSSSDTKYNYSTPGSLTTYTYGMTCTGEGGSASDSVMVGIYAPEQQTVQVVEPPELYLFAGGASASLTTTAGFSTSLSWYTKNAVSCTASGSWSGTKGTGGTESTGTLVNDSSVNITKPYTLTCQNSNGQTVSRTVNVIVRPRTTSMDEPTLQTASVMQSMQATIDILYRQLYGN